jgi:hypothetical protein
MSQFFSIFPRINDGINISKAIDLTQWILLPNVHIFHHKCTTCHQRRHAFKVPGLQPLLLTRAAAQQGREQNFTPGVIKP